MASSTFAMASRPPTDPSLSTSEPEARSPTCSSAARSSEASSAATSGEAKFSGAEIVPSLGTAAPCSGGGASSAASFSLKLQALSQTAQAKNLASRRQASSEMVISSSKAIAAFVHFHYHLDAQVLVATPLYFYV